MLVTSSGSHVCGNGCAEEHPPCKERLAGASSRFSLKLARYAWMFFQRHRNALQRVVRRLLVLLEERRRAPCICYVALTTFENFEEASSWNPCERDGLSASKATTLRNWRRCKNLVARVGCVGLCATGEGFQAL
mmetsp:Transcript_6536/g.18345  ORF Transcript_6536/g.18345 Transcript_6536/m.18345 type:complete len:134 (+) Transcript_6536:489-890(+)